jgi:Na+-translocating ferredoxin:NAD+ oxidoreductase RnfE subunit
LDDPRVSAGAKGVGVATGFAFLVLNGLFVAVHCMTNPVTGNLRVPMVVLVVGSLVALMVHVRVGMDSE